MHYYQWNIGDYASHTGYLTHIEDLGYRRLLDLYYLHEKALTNDIPKLCRVVGMREFEAEIQQVLSDFFDLDGDVWRNKRVDQEIALYRSKADTARENGKKGGRPVGSKKPRITQPVILTNPEITGSKANQELLTTNQEPTLTPLSSSDDAPKAKQIPYDQIREIYNANLPTLTGSRILSPKAKRNIERIWKMDERHQNREFWTSYFCGISQLTSRMDNWSGVANGNKSGNIELLTREEIFIRSIDDLTDAGIWG
jgi:uncharacterized protein YdaU (DUF1376 family)